jgi:ABC-type nitrate/sulfonate/bicarbonate transport system substrate-binding protein
MTRKCLTSWVGLIILFVFGISQVWGGETKIVRIMDFKPPEAPDIALALGFFEKEGITVKVVGIGYSAPEAINATEAGQVDASLSAVMPLIVARTKGIKVKFVADNARSTPSLPSEYFIVLNDSPINTVKDLKGKKIAINALGTYMDLYLRSYLEKNGLSPDKDVTILPIPWHTMEDALRAKQVDVMGIYGPFGDVALKKGGTRVILKDVITNINSVGYFFSEKFIRENPETTRAFLRAYVKGMNYMQDNPDEATRILVKYTGNPEGFVASSLKLFQNIPRDCRMDLESIKFQQELLLKYGYIDKKVPTEDLIDLSFLPRK